MSASSDTSLPDGAFVPPDAGKDPSAVSLDTRVSALLTNKRRVSALKSLGIVTVGDAVTYYPFRVVDPVPLRTLSGIVPGQASACVVTVVESRVRPMSSRRGWRLEVGVVDARPGVVPVTGPMATLVFFSGKRPYIAWMEQRLHDGSTVVIRGMAGTFNADLQFVHPDVDVVADPASLDGVVERVTRPRPVYHANSRISAEHLHETILQLLSRVDGTGVPDRIPEPILESRGFPHRREALTMVHDPASVEDFHRAIGALRYEEALVSQIAVLRQREQARAGRTFVCGNRSMVEGYLKALPFSLTDGQRRVIDVIARDMASGHPMRRLLQGEVGSGKTVVALAAMLQAVGSGHQAVLVAPTQVLAGQHVRSLRRMIDDAGLDVPIHLVTGGMRLARRRRVLAAVASGEPALIVATHAVFSRTFQAPDVAVVVIDEQHRFGVEQRGSLGRDCEGRRPHLLVMTATPIPRTAAMTWFGDLDVSELTELPQGRRPVTTVVVREEDGATMARMFAHVRARIDAGERAYVVCPRIDDDQGVRASSGDSADDSAEVEDDDGFEEPYADVESSADGEANHDDGGRDGGRPPLHAVRQMADRLASLPQFAGIGIVTLTGRDDDATKDGVMARFASGEAPLLVSTTVIEVGVDVPQASCIVVFDADRFGLSQLHQLRGRVGRGGTPAWAFLISRADPGSVAERRLDVVRATMDGARIASADLEMRGAGDVVGDAQSGLRSGFKLLRVVADAQTIRDARKDAERLLDDDPGLESHVQLAGAVVDFSRASETALLGA